MSKVFYLVYYELHDIPWKLKDPIKWELRPIGLQIQIGHGPYHIPKLASPTVKTKAGSAEISTINEDFVPEGGTYIGVVVPLPDDFDFKSLIPPDEWQKPAEQVDDIARTVGLCLNQRLGVRKIAEYVKEIGDDGKPGGMWVTWSAFAGAKAHVSKRSSNSIRRAILCLADQRVTPQVKLTLRWYEQSKNVKIGADRLLALWIALEALMAPFKGQADLMEKTARYLSHKDFQLGLNAETIKKFATLFDKEPTET